MASQWNDLTPVPSFRSNGKKTICTRRKIKKSHVELVKWHHAVSTSGSSHSHSFFFNATRFKVDGDTYGGKGWPFLFLSQILSLCVRERLRNKEDRERQRESGREVTPKYILKKKAILFILVELFILLWGGVPFSWLPGWTQLISFLSPSWQQRPPDQKSGSVKLFHPQLMVPSVSFWKGPILPLHFRARRF